MKRTNTAAWHPNTKRWYIAVQKDGVRKFFYSSTPGRTGQRECNAKADAWLDENLDGSVTANDMIRRWLEDVKVTTGPSNVRQISYFSGYISDVIGRMKMSYINEGHLQEVITKAYAKSHLSEKTLKGLRAAISQFIKYCRKYKTTTLTTEDLTIPTTAKKSTKRTLQPDDIKKLFTETEYRDGEEEWYIYAFRFQCAVGLRPGELMALENGDIEGNILHIRRSLNSFGQITYGKTKNAQRSYILPRVALDVLENQRNFLEKNGVKSDFVFPDRRGERTLHTNYSKHWYKFRDYQGIERISPYELRHTFVSMNKSAGKELLSPIVGHSAFMDTFGTYGHYISGEAERTAEIINENLERYIGNDVGF